MAEAVWYYAYKDQQMGPVSGSELRQLAASGKLAPQDLIWKEGMDEWAPAQKVKGLFPDSKAAAPAANHAATAVETPPPPAEEVPPPFDPPAPLAAIQATPPFIESSDAAPEVPLAFARTEAKAKEPARRTASRKSHRVETRPAGGALLKIQLGLWVACGFVLLCGGVLFTIAMLKAADAAALTAAGATYTTFFIGAYIIARAGDRLVDLLRKER